MSVDIYTKAKVDELLAAAGAGAGSGGLIEAMSGGDGLAAAVRLPTPSGWDVMLADTGGASADGFKYFTIFKAAGRISVPLDTYYAYTAGHNTNEITLVTAPTPAGPWTVRGSVLTPTAYLSSHKSSPWVVWWNGEVLLYVHGNIPNGSSQGTSVFRSSDGQTFVEHTSLAFNTTAATNPISFLAHAATYLRVVDAGGYLVAIFQANAAYSGGGASDVPVAAGWATSTDGLNWNIARAPLLANRPGERGLFDPSLMRVGPNWVLTGYNPARSKVEAWVSDRLKPGSFRFMCDWVGLEAVPGYDWIVTPTTFWDNGTHHLYAGSVDSTYVTKGKVHHTTLDWGSLR